MRQAQQSRSTRTTTVRPAAHRRDADAPVVRRRRSADAPTRVETRADVRPDATALPSALDDVDMDAILGETLPEPDAPVRTKRQEAAPLPASSESPAAPSTGWKSWRAMFEDGLRCQVQAIFEEHQLADAVEIAIEGARVTLRGRVPDVLTSQLVEDLAWSVPAVRQCENQLRVDG